ncbi:expressed unknown protein [Seminavis robusta]|uniref:Uncharacterized protein n=1 Tax=Seminavis robusta TaxID=568900 RepID=A0A9N8DMJ4_9STRA|nr:expressed unknown protein [Seminavis robusta]|eukprot:Sro227_g092150.1 n/a (599) ;mRNA; f:8514-10310
MNTQAVENTDASNAVAGKRKKYSKISKEFFEDFYCKWTQARIVDPAVPFTRFCEEKGVQESCSALRQRVTSRKQKEAIELLSQTRNKQPGRRKTTEPFHGHRGLEGEGGWWITLAEAEQRAKERWWLLPNLQGRQVPTQQYSTCKDAPANRPIWMFHNGDMYLGEWDEQTKMENGFGITFYFSPIKYKGLIHIGYRKKGFCHGKGDAFWLESAPSWRKNYFPASPIKRPSGGGGLPFCYSGHYKNGLQWDKHAVVRLKDGTTRLGPWEGGSPVGTFFSHAGVAAGGGTFVNAAHEVDSQDSSSEDGLCEERAKSVQQDDLGSDEDDALIHLETGTSCSNNTDSDSEESAKPPPRKPGRPKKHKTPVAGLDSEEKATPPPRKRGRPRKHKKPEACSDSEESAKKPEARRQRRKRWRPRKHSTTAIGQAEEEPAAQHQDDASTTNSVASRIDSVPVPVLFERDLVARVAASTATAQMPNVAAVKQEPIGEFELSSDSEADKDEHPLSSGTVKQAGEAEQVDGSNETVRLRQIREWIDQDVIGNNPSPDTISAYARQLFDEGFESVEMIKADLTEKDVNNYEWIKPNHKRKFICQIQRGWI